MDAIYWLIFFIVLLVIEIITLGLTTIWFAGGALAAFVLSLMEVPPVVQWAVFCAVSLILLFATRPWAVRYFNGQSDWENRNSHIDDQQSGRKRRSLCERTDLDSPCRRGFSGD